MTAAPMFGGLSLAHAPIASIPALTHYGADPVPRVYSVDQRSEPHFKPRGLWVSIDAGSFSWPEYVESQAGDHVYRLRFVHDVTLAADARILLITTVEDFDAFACQYGRNERVPPPNYYHYIDWKAVSEAYQGIVIAPYRCDRRLDGGLWYYGWDCASPRISRGRSSMLASPSLWWRAADMAVQSQPLAEMAVEERVLRIVVDVLCAEPERSVPEAYLVQDLGADSLDFVEIEFELEETFGLAFSGHDSGRLNRCATIADVARLVDRMLKRRSDAGEAA